MKWILFAAVALNVWPVSAAEGAFGTAGGETVIDPTSFSSSGTPNISFDGDGYIYSSPSGAFLEKALELPNGAEVVEVCVHAIDASDQGLVTVNLVGYEYQSTNPPSHRNFGLLGTGFSQMPGPFYDCFRPNPALVVHARDDLDGNGTPNYVNYRITAELGVPLLTRLGGIVVRWRRTLSPAPGTQTYDDVPIGSDYHPYVEALAAAGVTDGCVAGTSFCPDAPLTRAQFALMLARALGLEWPQ